MPNIKLKTLPTQDQTPVKKIEISILIEKEEDKFYLNFYSKKKLCNSACTILHLDHVARKIYFKTITHDSYDPHSKAILIGSCLK